MNRLSIAVMLMLVVLTGARAQNENDENVLSYYAIGNSLDGQPLVDKVNVLRFYPVFAFRDSVTSVKVTVYYGPHVFQRVADSMENKRFWKVVLPKFELGEAIQRLEVEVGFRVDGKYPSRFANAIARVAISGTNAKKEVATALPFVNSTAATAEAASRRTNLAPAYRERIAGLVENFGDVKEPTTELTPAAPSVPAAEVPQSLDNERLAVRIQQWAQARDSLDTLRQIVTAAGPGAFPDLKAADIQQASHRAGVVSDSLTNVQIADLERDAIADSLREMLRTQIEKELADSNLTGPSIRRSDIVVSKDLNSARILYRNYKTSLRRIPALDPSERLGIFRARFVPFAVVGDHLYTPFDSNTKIVFEVGLAFGNAVVAGDDFVIPEFAAQRLGVAFVITNELFSESASIRALALTYDFNSYGSLGVGANFPGRSSPGGSAVKPYFSFGINKKAFEDVVGQLGKLFQ